LRIFKTKWFERFARKNNINDEMLIDTVERTKKGLVDADLGGGVIKQRIARVGQGKSRGHRSIIVIRRDKMAFFVFGFSKNDQGNLRQDEEEEFRHMAKHLLSISEKDLDKALERGDFMEVRDND
jgi:hypothetical protein